MSVFSNIANRIGNDALSSLGRLSPVLKVGTDLLNQKRTSSVKEGKRALFGGLSESNWRSAIEDAMSIDRARGNLFVFSAQALETGTAPNMNMLVIDYSYSALTVRGESVNVGAGTFDKVEGVEAVQLSVTTYDDLGGSVKTWFKDLKRRIAPGDGTVGLPVDYLVRITITQGVPSTKAENASKAFSETYIMRPASIEYEGSRREDGLQELRLSFVQFDTFSSLI
ncbi:MULTISPECIES: hypothetical protein [Pseudomonas]|uniref:Uncharacterized protein n=1 Tax=Pseudomonas lutea TaxID=243924 RepID=A0A9X8MH12_9PSED|nr:MULTISPECIES: hypothetical protein [Pseudomonas]SER35240.1 hypothetical protein SAMN05216409_1183 [Pseudomonas lutea]